MKIFFSGLLILVLIAPAMGLLCHCCPDGALKSSELSIQSDPCNCCSASEVKRDNARFERTENLIPVSIRIPILRVSSQNQGLIVFASANQDSYPQVLGPPLFSSHTPLYLAGGILQI